MKQSLQHRETHDVQQQQKRPPSTPRIFRLGEEYNKKREKLKEELRADYRTAMAEVRALVFLCTSDTKQIQTCSLAYGQCSL